MRKLLTIVFLFYLGPVGAQVKIAARAGINFSTTGYAIDDGRKPGSGEIITRLNAGLLLRIPIEDDWSLLAGPGYSGKGMDRLPRDTSETRLNYLELPLSIAYRFSSSNETNFFAGAGIYAGYGFNGRLSWRGGRPETSWHLHKKEDNLYKRIEAGFNILCMIERNTKWGMKIDYSMSLLNVFKKNYKGKHAIIGCSAFWYF